MKWLYLTPSYGLSSSIWGCVTCSALLRLASAASAPNTLVSSSKLQMFSSPSGTLLLVCYITSSEARLLKFSFALIPTSMMRSRPRCFCCYFLIEGNFGSVVWATPNVWLLSFYYYCCGASMKFKLLITKWLVVLVLVAGKFEIAFCFKGLNFRS